MTRYFTKEHEWIDVDGDGVTATVGITRYAQEQLGDIVFVELPTVGGTLSQGGDAAVVESVKAASDVYAPVSGTVSESNERLVDDPALINTDPEGEGWFFRLTLADTRQLDDLLDDVAYQSFVAGL
jgi:glycine cleavage system H protein